MRNNWIPEIEAALHQYLAPPQTAYRRAAEAMAYSAEAGGKRLRPTFVLEFCKLASGDPQKAMAFACAVEMIHTYSLIHDDLPCMDNDDFRRGRPSCHKQFDEATALLAGDALLTRAFETLTDAPLSPEQIAKAVSVLAKCSGINGMVGGQVMDLQNETEAPSAEILNRTYELKTGALIQAACMLGVIAGNSNDKLLEDAREYGLYLGLAFQIIDDILDVSGDETLLGKPVGSDAANGKHTFVTVYGMEKSREMAAQYTQKALTIIQAYPDSESLTELTRELLVRKY